MHGTELIVMSLIAFIKEVYFSKLRKSPYSWWEKCEIDLFMADRETAVGQLVIDACYETVYCLSNVCEFFNSNDRNTKTVEKTIGHSVSSSE